MKKKYNFDKQVSFFKERTGELNDARFTLRRTRGLISSLLVTNQQVTNSASLTTPLGYLSFSLYYARLMTNFTIIIKALSRSHQDKKKILTQSLFFQMMNDALWGTINALQFFVFTSSISKRAGQIGLILEMVGLSIDIANFIFQSAKGLIGRHLIFSSEKEKALYYEAMQYKQLKFMRSFMHMLSILTLLILLSVSIFPSSLLLLSIFVISFTSFLIKSAIEINHTNNDIKFLKTYASRPIEVKLRQQEKRQENKKLLKEGLINYVIFPALFYVSLMLAPTPFFLVLTLLLVALSFALKKDANATQIKSELEMPNMTNSPYAPSR